MPDYKEILKKGWHPEKEGTTLKGQVKGVFKRNTSPPRRDASKPISALRDPSTFAPPPTRVRTGLGATSPSSSAPPPPPYRPALPGLESEAQVDGEAADIHRPYHINTTGLSTSHLPPPPVRRDGTVTGTTRPPPPPPPRAIGVGGPPSLPPRLPPRNPPSSPASSQMSDLKSRFGKLSSNLSSPDEPSAAPSPPPTEGGTTWAQKKAALETASKFKKNPGSVSLSDARSAASTANNFRQRHGEQVASGMRTAGRLEEKYGIASKVGQYAGTSAQAQSGGAGAGSGSTSGALISSGNITTAVGLLGKKTPPAPPPKRRDLSGASLASGRAPPPIPTSTRPTF